MTPTLLTWRNARAFSDWTLVAVWLVFAYPGLARAQAPEYSAPNLGITYQFVRYGQAYGARLTRNPAPGSVAAQLGLEPGDTIVSLDGQAITGPQDVLNHINRTTMTFVDFRINQLRSAEFDLPAQGVGTATPSAGLVLSQESLPEIRLRAVAEAYQKLAAYSDHGRLHLIYNQLGAPGDLTLPVPLSFVRSESLAWDAMVTGLFADRESVTLVNPQLACPPFTALVASDFLGRVEPPVPIRNRWKVALADAHQAKLLGLGGPTLLVILETLMTRRDAAVVLRQQSRQMRSWPYQFLHEGRRWWVVEIRLLAQEPPINVWIDPDTNLVEWISMPLRPANGEDGTVGDATLQWESRRIDIDVDRVREALGTMTRRLRAGTQNFPQLPAPPVAVPAPVPVPGEAVPPAPKPGVIPQAPSKVYPASTGVVPPATGDIPATALRDPAGALPYVAVSLVVQPTPQTPGPMFYQPSQPGRSLIDRLLEFIICRIRPQDCLPMPASTPAPAPAVIPAPVP